MFISIIFINGLLLFQQQKFYNNNKIIVIILSSQTLSAALLIRLLNITYFFRDKVSTSFWQHLPAELCTLFERYDLIRSRMVEAHSWKEEGNSSFFFLNASDEPFDRLDCNRLSEEMGCDITSKVFR